MKINNQKGFTLIELLVVIAIISLLSSVVLAAVNSSRLKAKEGYIKSTLNSIQKQVKLLDFDGSSYVDLCHDQKILSIIDTIKKNDFNANCQVLTDPRFDTIWGVSAIMKSNPDKRYSVSEAGVGTWEESYNPDTYMDRPTGVTFCNGRGGRLPSQAELYTLFNANGSTPTGFLSANYLGSEIAKDGSGLVTLINMNNGYMVVGGSGNTRCLI